jgi:hypothetical protein
MRLTVRESVAQCELPFQKKERSIPMPGLSARWLATCAQGSSYGTKADGTHLSGERVGVPRGYRGPPDRRHIAERNPSMTQTIAFQGGFWCKLEKLAFASGPG